ncbi:MAG: glycosyltransferase family 4 protein [Gammaproteobacteria bacterium]|nr:glycosyltransferase family 4 protein [Gammaproteobacteria bacterium]
MTRAPERRILLVGPLPMRRKEGVSTSFQSLVDGLSGDEASVINTNWMREVQNPGRFNPGRAFESLIVVFRVLLTAWRFQSVYLIVATSRLGFIRDASVVLAARLFGCRVVGHLHGGGMRRFYISGGTMQRCMIRAVYGQFAILIVLGDRLRSQFRFMRQPQRLRIVPNGLPADVQVTADRQKELDFPLRILYLSNITPSKGITDVLRAIAVLDKTTDVELNVCGAFLSDVDVGAEQGATAFKAELKRLIDDLGIAGKVSFHGTVSGDLKETMLETSHILVLPTYYRWEGQPLSIIEAQAYGLPVVTTAHRAIPETVEFGKSAERCEPRDHQSIVAAIRRIAESQQTYTQYSTAARDNYRDRFTTQTHIENMRRVLFEA